MEVEVFPTQHRCEQQSRTDVTSTRFKENYKKGLIRKFKSVEIYTKKD
jgi:hypothetical protein